MIDISESVRKFVSKVDSQIDRLGYDIKGIILQYSAYRDGAGNDLDPGPLSDTLYRFRMVEDKRDAKLIAEIAVTSFYPEITEEIRAHGYLAGAITEVVFKNVKRNNSLHCHVVMMVV